MLKTVELSLFGDRVGNAESLSDLIDCFQSHFSRFFNVRTISMVLCLGLFLKFLTHPPPTPHAITGRYRSEKISGIWRRKKRYLDAGLRIETPDY